MNWFGSPYQWTVKRVLWFFFFIIIFLQPRPKKWNSSLTKILFYWLCPCPICKTQRAVGWMDGRAGENWQQKSVVTGVHILVKPAEPCQVSGPFIVLHVELTMSKEPILPSSPLGILPSLAFSKDLGIFRRSLKVALFLFSAPGCVLICCTFEGMHA